MDKFIIAALIIPLACYPALPQGGAVQTANEEGAVVKKIESKDGKTNIEITITIAPPRSTQTTPAPPTIRSEFDGQLLLDRLDRQNELLEEANQLARQQVATTAEQNTIAERQARSLGKANTLGLVNAGANVAGAVASFLTWGRLGSIRATLNTDKAPATVVIQKVVTTANGGDAQANGGDVDIVPAPTRRK